MFDKARRGEGFTAVETLDTMLVVVFDVARIFCGRLMELHQRMKEREGLVEVHLVGARVGGTGAAVEVKAAETNGPRAGQFSTMYSDMLQKGMKRNSVPAREIAEDSVLGPVVVHDCIECCF